MFEADKQHMLPVFLEEEAIKEIEKIYNEKGFYAAYEEITRQLEVLFEKRYISPADMAFRYYMINQDEKAIEWIEKGAERHDPGILLLCRMIKLTRLYNNPRFIAVFKEMNLPLPKSN